MRIPAISALLLLFVVVACGGGGGGTEPPNNQTLASITVSPSTLNIGAGQSTSLSVSGTDTNGQPVSGLTGVTLVSQNQAIAEVSGTEVLGVSAGNTTINVSAGKGGVTKQTTVPTTVSGQLPSNANVNATVTNLFTPGSVIVKQGGAVTWNFASVAHTVNFAGSPGAPQNIDATADASVARTFNTTGNFAYQCTIHAGMSGTVLVR